MEFEEDEYYDYAGNGDEDIEYGDEDVGGGEELYNSPYEEEDVAGDIAEVSEEPENTIMNPDDYRRTGFFGEKGGVVTDPSMKKTRDAQQIFLAQTWSIISGDYDLGEALRSSVFGLIEKIPKDKLLLQNTHVIVAAALYMIEYKNKITKENIAVFTKKHLPKNVDVIDFIRYIRKFENLF